MHSFKLYTSTNAHSATSPSSFPKNLLTETIPSVQSNVILNFLNSNFNPKIVKRITIKGTD